MVWRTARLVGRAALLSERGWRVGREREGARDDLVERCLARLVDRDAHTSLKTLRTSTLKCSSQPFALAPAVEVVEAPVRVAQLLEGRVPGVTPERVQLGVDEGDRAARPHELIEPASVASRSIQWNARPMVTRSRGASSSARSNEEPTLHSTDRPATSAAFCAAAIMAGVGIDADGGAGEARKRQREGAGPAAEIEHARSSPQPRLARQPFDEPLE